MAVPPKPAWGCNLHLYKTCQPSSINFDFIVRCCFALALFDSGLGHLSLAPAARRQQVEEYLQLTQSDHESGPSTCAKLGQVAQSVSESQRSQLLKEHEGWVIWRLVPAARRQQVEEYLQLTQNDHKSGPSTCAKLGQVAQSVSRISMFSTLEGT